MASARFKWGVNDDDDDEGSDENAEINGGAGGGDSETDDDVDMGLEGRIKWFLMQKKDKFFFGGKAFNIAQVTCVFARMSLLFWITVSWEKNKTKSHGEMN